MCASIESLRIPFDANAFRESQKEKDLRIETVNGEGGVRVAKKFIFKFDLANFDYFFMNSTSIFFQK